MNSCELVSLSTFIACSIAKCATKDETAMIAALLNQVASTLGVIAVNESQLAGTTPPIPEVSTEPELITINPFPLR